MLRNGVNVTAIKPLTSLKTAEVAHAIWLGHDGKARGTSETDILPTSFGSGDIGIPLDMVGTLGTALSANDGWLTLTGSADHCYSAPQTSGIERLYNANGGLLLFGQFKASISTNSNASPCMIMLGTSSTDLDKSVIRLGLSQANAGARLMYKSAGDDTIRTSDADSGMEFTDDTISGAAAFIDFGARTFTFFHDGLITGTGLLTGSSGNTFAPAFDSSVPTNSVVVGGSYSGSSYFSGFLWEDQLRRVGAVGFSQIPSDIEAKMLELHQSNYVPYGVFTGES